MENSTIVSPEIKNATILQKVKLKDLVKISKGRKTTEVEHSNLRYIQIGDLRNDDKIKFAERSKSNILCTKKDILIAWDGANAGTIGYDLEGAIGSTLAKLVINRTYSISPIYLGRFLQTKSKSLRDNCTGATIPHISRAELESIEIPLPSLPTQQKIAAILDKADELRQYNKQLIEKYDALTQSLFLDMFGDPVKNEKGWEIKKIGDFGRIITGSTPSRNDTDNYSSKHIEWIKTDNIDATQLHVTQSSEYLSEIGLSRGRYVEKGALLVACIAGSIDSIGRASLTDRKVSFNQQINAIQPYDNVHPNFLYYLFKNTRKHIQNHASNGMKRMLTKGEFEKIVMIVPSIKIQNQFAERVHQIELQKQQAQEALEKSEALFQGLLQQAFKGELN